jgi:hypothetical protein
MGYCLSIDKIASPCMAGADDEKTGAGSAPAQNLKTDIYFKRTVLLI